MVSGLPQMPWGVWFRLHASAFVKAVPISLMLAVEARDLYNRGAWDLTSVSPLTLDSGDVLLICNRWYAMDTFADCARSLFTKALFKTVFDDVAVIVKQDNVPMVLSVGSAGVQCRPLNEFLERRVPRGVALRRLRPEGSGSRNPLIADQFMTHVATEKVHPWAQFRSAYRSKYEQEYYNFSVEVSIFEAGIRRREREGAGTRLGLQAAEKTLEDMRVYQRNLSKLYPAVTEFKLFNGSLVASFLASQGFLDKMVPSPARYVVTDFCHDVPIRNAVLDEPLIIYRS